MSVLVILFIFEHHFLLEKKPLNFGFLSLRSITLLIEMISNNYAVGVIYHSNYLYCMLPNIEICFIVQCKLIMIFLITCIYKALPGHLKRYFTHKNFKSIHY